VIRGSRGVATHTSYRRYPPVQLAKPGIQPSHPASATPALSPAAQRPAGWEVQPPDLSTPTIPITCCISTIRIHKRLAQLGVFVWLSTSPSVRQERTSHRVEPRRSARRLRPGSCETSTKLVAMSLDPGGADSVDIGGVVVVEADGLSDGPLVHSTHSTVTVIQAALATAAWPHRPPRVTEVQLPGRRRTRAESGSWRRSLSRPCQ
jgi:hypothetical protein